LGITLETLPEVKFSVAFAEAMLVVFIVSSGDARVKCVVLFTLDNVGTGVA
jgi:hypothetical protein